jgi:membrane associated rhomboid family serine protease
VINVFVFVMFTYEQCEPYMLDIGDRLHPLQWLTCNFLHADISHILFNMLFLWVFGPVVEGKLGMFKMLALYLGICILFGAVVQILTLEFAPSHALGASGVIFGLAAISFIWAPESKVQGVIIFWCIRLFVKDTETEIMLLVGFFAVLQALLSIFVFGNLATPLLHLAGAVIGLIVGITMLKANLVDCAYEDIFSVYSGAKERAEIEAKNPEAVQPPKESLKDRQKRQKHLIEEIELAVQNQTPLPAFVIARRTEQEFTDWTLPQELHLKMIRQLLAGKHWTESIASMQQYLERHREQASFVRLMLAQAFLTRNKPYAAIEILDNISLQDTGAELQSAIPKIRAKAEALHRKNQDEGIYEMAE